MDTYKVGDKLDARDDWGNDKYMLDGIRLPRILVMTMSNNSIQIASVFIASLMVIGSLISASQLADAQENQTEVQNSTQIEVIIDELLQIHPVLSELMQDDDIVLVEYLNELDTQEAVHTMLALKSLQSLIELQSSHMMAEGLGNQTAAMANQTADTVANQIN